jgi:hypothetical protein
MPAATPLPRGPSVLTLYSAEDLLTAPGCPVCRYAAEADDRYLGWFALEGHAEPAMITAMCASLGMCAAHTRRLASQPGAAIRLTAVYRYVLIAARDLLSGRAAAVRPCPACQRRDAASRNALETLLDGLASGEAAGRCRDLGGVCIPHLTAAVAAGPRRVAAWLADTMHEMLIASPAAPRWLAGTDPDAEDRAALRRAPRADARASGTCTACLAAVRAEHDSLARLRTMDQANPAVVLCAPHLADAAAVAADSGRLRSLLTWQAACAGTLSARRLRSGRMPGCLICSDVGRAAEDALADLARACQSRSLLCVRHYLVACAGDKRAGLTLGPGLAHAADLLIGELADAFEQSTWASRHGAPVSPWLRAAAFLDGAVLGGAGAGGS